MCFIAFATSLLIIIIMGVAHAKSIPTTLRNKKDAAKYQKRPTTPVVEECNQSFAALDQDNSRDISLSDIEIVSQHLSQAKRAELTDALSQILYATGVTSIQDNDFRLSHADYMYFCMNADDMEAAIAKRAKRKKASEMNAHPVDMTAELRQHIAMEQKKQALKKKKLALTNNNNHHLQLSCTDYCEREEYCGSAAECRDNGSCGTLDDCYNPENLFDRESCVGAIECNSGECSLNCGAEQPSCFPDDCQSGQYCGSEGCQPTETCGTVEDCFLPGNSFPIPYILCEARYQCTGGYCVYQCNDW